MQIGHVSVVYQIKPSSEGGDNPPKSNEDKCSVCQSTEDTKVCFQVDGKV